MRLKVDRQELGRQFLRAPPAIAVVSSSSQGADASGGDENAPVQANPVTTVVPISAN